MCTKLIYEYRKMLYKHKNMQTKIENINYKAYQKVSKYKYLS